MRTTQMLFVAVAATLLSPSLALQVGQRKPPVQKPPIQKPPKLGAIGTSQLPGEVCTFGRAYTLGKQETNALNFNLISAEYRATRVKIGRYYMSPKAETKLLVVHYTVHNPLPKEQQYGRNIQITAVMPDGKNIESFRTYLEEPPNIELSQRFKPAQKVGAYSVLEVPADDPVEKLIVANRAASGSLVARYMLGSLVKPLETMYADPSDASGCRPLKMMRVPFNTSVQIGGMDVAVLGIEAVSGEGVPELGKPGRDKAWVMVTYQVKCMNEEGGSLSGFGGNWLGATVIDSDGGGVGGVSHTFRPNSFGTFRPTIVHGETGTFRRAYKVSAGVPLDHVKLKEFAGREVRFDLGGFRP